MGRGEAQAETASAANSMAAEDVLQQNYHGARLLLAEDNVINQEVAVGLLREAGLSVDLAENGIQALAMAAEGNYALILMDMQMPDMDGVAATRHIRALPQGKTVPIIAMTANAFADDRERCFSAGMNDFIAKPIDPENVFATLLKWLPASAGSLTDGRAAPAPLQATPAPPVGAEAAVLSRLQSLPGIDLSRGIAVVRGNTARYLGLLQRFIATHAEDMDHLAQRVTAGDQAAAVRLAHSLKGASATLGVNKLAETAQCIEFTLRAATGTTLTNLPIDADMAVIRQEFAALTAVLTLERDRT
jgi:CheY-like chemotaxis protein